MEKLSLRVLAIFVVCLSVYSAFGQQNIYLGFKGGLSIPNLKSGSNNQNPLANGYSSRVGADLGIVAIFKINDWFSIQPELVYSQQGGKKDGLQPIPNTFPPYQPPYLYANFNSVARLNYYMLPIMARFDFRLSEKFKLFVNAGGFVSLLGRARQVNSGGSYIYEDSGGKMQVPGQPYQTSFNNNMDIRNDEHRCNAGVAGAVGFSYDIPGGKIFVDGGFTYGFVVIQRDVVNGANYSGAATVHLGYLVAIK